MPNYVSTDKIEQETDPNTLCGRLQEARLVSETEKDVRSSIKIFYLRWNMRKFILTEDSILSHSIDFLSFKCRCIVACKTVKNGFETCSHVDTRSDERKDSPRGALHDW